MIDTFFILYSSVFRVNLFVLIFILDLLFNESNFSYKCYRSYLCLNEKAPLSFTFYNLIPFLSILMDTTHEIIRIHYIFLKCLNGKIEKLTIPSPPKNVVKKTNTKCKHHFLQMMEFTFALAFID
jgi:hypothetical protein